jgi:hypothetical protein
MKVTLYLMGYNAVQSVESQPSRALLAACFRLVSFLAYCSTLKMETRCSSETSVVFSRLHGVISQYTELFIKTAVRTSNPT